MGQGDEGWDDDNARQGMTRTEQQGRGDGGLTTRETRADGQTARRGDGMERRTTGTRGRERRGWGTTPTTWQMTG
jgi:hypothetical protein